MTVPTDAAPEDRPSFLGPDLSPDENAPNGYMIDPLTGERRPKKKAGRPRRNTPPESDGGPPPPAPPGPPSLEELRTRAPRAEAPPDRVPGSSRDRRGRVKAPKPPVDVPPFRAGPIAKGVNRIYFKAGKLVKIVDPMVGQALINITRKDMVQDEGTGQWVPDPDDVTVGEAWEELARTNPRIRAFLLKLITSGAWMTLIMVHAPVLLALIMRDGVRQRIPFNSVVSALLVDDEEDDQDVPEQAGGMGDLLSMLRPEDILQMSDLFSGVMGNMAGGMPRQPGPVRTPVVDGFGEEPEGPPA